MSVNPAVEGRTYRMPGRHRVTAEEIAAFRRAVGGTGDSDVAPPTFAVTITQRAEAQFMRDPEAGVDYARLVHGEEAIVHSAPIRAGEEIVAETVVTRVRSVGGNDMITLSTCLVTIEGEPRCRTTSTVVIRGEGNR